MASELAVDAFSDHQPSTFPDHLQRRVTGGISGGQRPPGSVVDDISARVLSLEERLNACDSIYRLAAQAGAVRYREQREQQQTTSEYARSFEERVISAEQKVKSIPDLIRDTIRDEMRRYDNTKAITSLLDRESAAISDRLSGIDRSAAESARHINKSIKKLRIESRLARSQPEEDNRVDEFMQQVAEIKRRQTLVVELVNAARSHSERDFDEVNSQLAGLWAQLSTRRENPSPRRP